jgi:hypothetical protein
VSTDVAKNLHRLGQLVQFSLDFITTIAGAPYRIVRQGIVSASPSGSASRVARSRNSIAFLCSVR